ncbi:hypothetical protein HPP92_027059, partial [Vanilla planifolia]
MLTSSASDNTQAKSSSISSSVAGKIPSLFFYKRAEQNSTERQTPSSKQICRRRKREDQQIRW